MGTINEAFIYICVVLAVFSAISSGLVIYAHFKIPQLHKHPGQMIVIICLIQFVYDLHWVGILQATEQKIIEPKTCQIFGFIFNLMYYLSWNILASLAIELIIKIKKPLSTNYKSRLKLYTLLTIMSTAFEVALVTTLGEYGQTSLDTCFLKIGSKGYWVELIILLINLPLVLLCLGILYRSSTYKDNKALQKIVRACLSMVFTWGIPLFTDELDSMFNQRFLILDYISLFLGSASGMILALTRLGSKEIISRVWMGVTNKKKSLRNNKLKNLNQLLIEGSSVGNFYKNFTDDKIKDLLLVLLMALVTDKACKENYCYGYKKRKKYFEKSEYGAVSRLVDLSGFRLESNGIWEYESEYFEKIRNSCEITTEQLIKSISLSKNFEEPSYSDFGGKSGAFFFRTADEQLVLKTLTRSEKFFLLDILPAYTKRIIKHRDSKIVRILGLFKVRSTKQSFVIMENIVKKKEKMNVFDLKGSTDGRYVESFMGSFTVMKDNNLVEMGLKVMVSDEARKRFSEVISEDCRFFRKFQIIDYSLLVAFYEDCSGIESRYFVKGLDNFGYCFGVIDFLQEYTLYKKAEIILKRLRMKNNFSVCSPGEYSKRFLKFVEEILFD